jgi:hypothetical protein
MSSLVAAGMILPIVAQSITSYQTCNVRLAYIDQLLTVCEAALLTNTIDFTIKSLRQQQGKFETQYSGVNEGGRRTSCSRSGVVVSLLYLISKAERLFNSCPTPQSNIIIILRPKRISRNCSLVISMRQKRVHQSYHRYV